MAFLDFHLVSPISTLFHPFLLISTTSTFLGCFLPTMGPREGTGDVSIFVSPHHGDPKQAQLMSDLGIMIKAEGQSSILSKCCIMSKYYNQVTSRA